ncbi:MAG: EamA family transporter [Roseobacter sp.]
MAFALAAGTCYGAYLAMTRTVANKYRPKFLLISQLLIGSIVLTPLGLSAEFPILDLPIGVLLLVSACGSALGNYLLVVANRAAEASLIAPLVYSQLVSAALAGGRNFQ